MSLNDNRRTDKAELKSFRELDYQNLIYALEIIYYDYWNLFNKDIKKK